MGTGSTFLAFAAVSKKDRTRKKSGRQKSFYYLEGFTEGTETIIFCVLICIFPTYFPILALIFGIFCWATVIGRFGTAFNMLR